MSDQITIQNQNEGSFYSVAGGNYRIIISGKETNGECAVIEMNVPPGGGPGPHAHKDIHESFYVAEGEVEFKTTAGKYLAKKGAFVNIPKGGQVHCFKNETDQMAVLLCTVMPAGLEAFFAEIGEPVAPGKFLPPPVMDDGAKQKLKALGEKYGQEFFPPDYLDRK